MSISLQNTFLKLLIIKRYLGEQNNYQHLLNLSNTEHITNSFLQFIYFILEIAYNLLSLKKNEFPVS